MAAWVKEQGKELKKWKVVFDWLGTKCHKHISICVTEYSFPSFTRNKMWLKVWYSPLSDTVCCFEWQTSPNVSILFYIFEKKKKFLIWQSIVCLSCIWNGTTHSGTWFLILFLLKITFMIILFIVRRLKPRMCAPINVWYFSYV